MKSSSFCFVDSKNANKLWILFNILKNAEKYIIIDKKKYYVVMMKVLLNNIKAVKKKVGPICFSVKIEAVSFRF